MARTARARSPGAARAADGRVGPGQDVPRQVSTDQNSTDVDGPEQSNTDQNNTGGEGITIHLDELLAERGMTLTELSERVGITVVNLSVLKNGRARAVRFSTLAGLCAELGCQPGDLLSYEPGRPAS
jgi:putative transcriptional regulator